MDYDTLTHGVFVGLSRKEEVLREVRSYSRNFVLAPVVTQVQVLRSVDI